jgi:hypothetical protein
MSLDVSLDVFGWQKVKDVHVSGQTLQKPPRYKRTFSVHFDFRQCSQKIKMEKADLDPRKHTVLCHHNDWAGA